MIFTRRALQRRLDELRPFLGDTAVGGLASRLNRPDEHRLGAMWEVVILHALSKQGSFGHEAALPSGRRPDVDFAGQSISFVADITATSDEGLHEKNPYDELNMLIEQWKNRLGLPVGGVDLQVRSREERSSRGSRTVLRLPDRGHLRDFMKAEIEPRLRAQLRAGDTVLHVDLDDDKAGIHLTIDPTRSPNSTGSYGSYDMPTIKDRNPLYNALERKASQLRGATGLTGIVVGDADSSTLADQRFGGNGVSSRTIALEFLRQYSSIGFVLLLSIREENSFRPHRTKPIKRWIHPLLVLREGSAYAEPLNGLIHAMIAQMPKPIEMPVNAALRAREAGYGWGHRGSHELSWKFLGPSMRIKISARELMELLAGRRSIDETNHLHGWLDPEHERGLGQVENPFELRLREGQLPVAVSVIKTDEDDSDDWVEFQFGGTDPAITPFK